MKLISRLIYQDGGAEAGDEIGEFLIVGGGTEGVLDHTHFGIEVVDHGDKDSFRGSGLNCGAPFEFSLMGEDNMLKPVYKSILEAALESGPTDHPVPENDVTVEMSEAAL